MFSGGLTVLELAAALEVSTKSAYAWRRRWVAGGERAVLSKGPPARIGVCQQSRCAGWNRCWCGVRRRRAGWRISGGRWRGWPPWPAGCSGSS
ncbi:hypothetical protein [Pilimelia terevasa]|uniref:hypothetical protein n=1 Tax=Pilimelia terevasa TaxID=53372 RepID=UPI003570BF2A